MNGDAKSMLRQIIPEGDNLAALAAIIYAAAEAYGVDLPMIDLSGASGLGPLLLLLLIVGMFFRNRVRARFDTLEERLDAIDQSIVQISRRSPESRT